ncbi:hypothetical protein [Bradyrhizobium sp. F1.13.3]|uniref:hypothetical protein n=1 Tax=Bradyrhizobium sp. F1.13.3 TaxID=3156351 RepID=UPI00339394F8
MRIKGWARIGIVLSAIWAIGGGLYQNNEELSRSNSFFQFAYEVCQRGKDAGTTKDFDCFKQSWEDAKPFREPRLGDVLFMAFAPLPVCWLFAFLVILIFRWIRRGFAV